MAGLAYWLDDMSTIQRVKHSGITLALIGTNLQNDIENMFIAVPSLQALILRDVEGSENYKPAEQMANELCDIADRYPERRIICASLNMKTDPAKVVPYENLFIDICHLRGHETICLNFPFGKFDAPELEPFKEIALRSDFVGPQLYDGYRYATREWSDRKDNSLRYRKWPTWWPRHKTIATECGIDLWRYPEDPQWEGADKPGWANMGISEGAVIARMGLTVLLWSGDELLGGVFFALKTLNPEWDSYQPTDNMIQSFSTFGTIQLPPKNINNNMPDEENAMPDYNVGTGIREAMDKTGDSPVEDEQYLWPDKYSICTGEKYIYIYTFAGNYVAASPKVIVNPAS
jgi:hypothetical protein